VTSLHYHFPWIVKSNIKWSIFCAATKRKFRKNLDWEPFYEIAAKDPEAPDAYLILEAYIEGAVKDLERAYHAGRSLVEGPAGEQRARAEKALTLWGRLRPGQASVKTASVGLPARCVHGRRIGSSHGIEKRLRPRAAGEPP